MVTVTICSDFGASKNKVWHCFHRFPIYLPGGDGTGWHDLSFFQWWVLSQLFHPPLSLSSKGSLVSLHFCIKCGVICISELNATSPRMPFHMMYYAYKLNKQGDNKYTLFQISNHSIVPCPDLIIAFWPAYRFLRRNVGWSGILISLGIFHSLLWSTKDKGFSAVNEAEVQALLEFSCFFYDPTNVGNLIPGSSSFSK